MKAVTFGVRRSTPSHVRAQRLDDWTRVAALIFDPSRDNDERSRGIICGLHDFAPPAIFTYLRFAWSRHSETSLLAYFSEIFSSRAISGTLYPSR